MTQAEQAKLDAICAEAFAKLDALDMRAYHQGLITGKWCDCSWCSHRKPALTAPGDTRPKDKGPKPSSTVLNPKPQPKLPGGDIVDDSLNVAMADLATVSAKIKALART